MIKAKIFRNNQNRVSGFEITGHAGYAEEGSDIICAAVSSIAYTAVGYFSEKKIGGKEPQYSEKDGYMKFKPDLESVKDSDEATAAYAVLEATFIGLKQIEYSYGKEYIKVIEKSVD